MRNNYNNISATKLKLSLLLGKKSSFIQTYISVATITVKKKIESKKPNPKSWKQSGGAWFIKKAIWSSWYLFKEGDALDNETLLRVC